MPTPIVNLDAVRGTDFSEVITLANDIGAPVSTTNAQALFVLRTHPRGLVILEKDNTDGISFGASNLEIRITEQELESIQYNSLYYDLFLHLSGDVKKKISRGLFEIE